MLTEELIELVRMVGRFKAESQHLELKAAHIDCPKRLYDTFSSFSNQDGGGTILFGVDENQSYKPVGVYDLQSLQKKVTEQCNQMEPPVRAVFTFAEVDGKPVCAAEIPGLDVSERPCYYRGTGRLKGSYLRVGDVDLPMTDAELYSYEAFHRHLHDDERPISRASLALLDEDLLQNYLIQKRLERPGFAKLTEEQAYEMMGIMQNGVPTLAAVLNFCLYPQGYLPQLAITAIVVPGTQIGDLTEDASRFLDNKRIEGTLSAMLEEAMLFCKRNMKIRTIIDPQTGMRRDRTEYPLSAVREIILNALIHRDYSIYTEGTPIQINFFSDRLEIHSPGGLYGRMTIDQLGISRPDLRNPALALMMEMLASAENRYSGIPTIRREMSAYGLPAPVFENRRGEFVVTLYNAESAYVRQPARQEKVHGFSEDAVSYGGEAGDLLSFCQVPRTRKEIADYLGVKTIFYVTNRYIDPLLQSGALKMTIPDKPRSRHQQYYAATLKSSEELQ